MKAPAALRFNVDGFTYHPETGCIFKDGRRRDFNEDSDDYRKVHSSGVQVQAHLLAWRLYYGSWPPANRLVDHENQNKQDNRISNLRLATKSQNNANGPAHRRSKSGERGVFWCKTWKRWKIHFSCGTKFYGTASHKISAIVAARLIRRVLYGEFAPSLRAANKPKGKV